MWEWGESKSVDVAIGAAQVVPSHHARNFAWENSAFRTKTKGIWDVMSKASLIHTLNRSCGCVTVPVEIYYAREQVATSTVLIYNTAVYFRDFICLKAPSQIEKIQHTEDFEYFVLKTENFTVFNFMVDVKLGQFLDCSLRTFQFQDIAPSAVSLSPTYSTI